MDTRTLGALALFAAIAFSLPLPAAAQAADAGDPVVATVNGDKIFASDVREAKERLIDRFREFPLEAVFDGLVAVLVDSKLAAAEARARGLDGNAEVKRYLARIEEQVLERAFVRQVVQERLTDERLRKRYREMLAERDDRDQVHARHILVETEAEARRVISDLDGGADFAALAKEHSIGPSRSQGGDLGFFAPDEMVAEFSRAAFAMEPGAVAKTPVQTQYGWHVIQVLERRKAPPVTFEASEKELRAGLTREIGGEVMRELREAADIQRFAIDGSPLRGEQKKEKKE